MTKEGLNFLAACTGHELTNEERTEFLGTNNTQTDSEVSKTFSGIDLGDDYASIPAMHEGDEEKENITPEKSTTDNDALKSKTKNLTPNQLASIGVAQLVEGKTDEIICPHCGNGSKHSKTGLTASYFNDGWQYHCFACDESFDNIKLFAEYFNLDSARDFTEILRRADELTKNISAVDAPQKNNVKKELTDAEKVSLEKEIAGYVSFIDDYPDEDKRGLTLDTLKAFYCGYALQWSHPKIPSLLPTPRLIIPNGKYSFNAVLPNRYRDKIDKKFWKLNVNSVEIFNAAAISPDTINIIVEGEIDAMSIYQAMGGNVNVCALGGTSFTNKFINHIVEKFSADDRKNLSFLVMLDNDDAGVNAAKKLVEGLLKINCAAVSDVLITGTCKIDANDILIEYGENFLKKLIEDKLNDAKTKLDDVRKKLLESTKNVMPSTKTSKPTTQKVMSDCPIDLHIPNNFMFTSNGIFSKDIVCNNPVVITKKLRDVDTGKSYSEIAYYDRYYKKWETKHYPDSVLSDYRAIGKLADDGINFSQESAKALSKYFVALPFESDNLFKIPHNLLYNRMGWTDDTFTKFIYPDHLEGGDVLNDPKLMYRDKFKSKGNCDKWRKAIKKHFTNLQTSAAFRVIFGAVLAAPLYRILGLRNAQYLLWCSTGKGKSATVKIAMSIYGDPEELKHTFNGTVHSINTIPFYFQDSVVWMDEFQSASKAVREDMPSIIYGQAEAKTRSRLSRDGSSIPISRFHGVRIFTAEQPVIEENTDAGAYNRLLSISTDNLFAPNTNIAEVHRFFNQNYGFFGSVWIDFIKNHIEEIRRQFATNQKYFDTKAQQGDWTNSWSDHNSVNLTALQFAMPLIDPDEALTFDDVKKFFLLDFETIEKEIPRNSSVTNQQRALHMLEDYINSHPRNFKREISINSTARRMVQSVDGNAYDLKGFQFLDGTFGFIPTALNKILKDELGFNSATAILRGWQEKGLLQSPNNKHVYARRRRIIDGTVNKPIMLICFKEGVLNAEVIINRNDQDGDYPVDDYPSTF